MPKDLMPEIDPTLCHLCGDCATACPSEALTIALHQVQLDQDRCSYCGDCEDICPTGAISLPYEIWLGPVQDADSDS